MEKECSKCHQTKSLNEFYLDKGKYRPDCKLCKRNNRKIYVINNLESVKQKKKIFYTGNKDKIDTKKKEWYTKNQECIKLKRKIDYIENKEVILKESKEYYSKTKDSRKNKRREISRKSYRKNAQKYIDKGARYRNRVQISLLEKFRKEVRDFYKNRPKGYEVDHIIPISNKIVCGLHVPWNLQYLTPEENRSKGNKLIGNYGNS